jgi:hypothetical protein
VDVVEHDHHRRGRGRGLEQLAKRPGDLLARCHRLLLAEQSLDHRYSGRVDLEAGRLGQLLHHLDHGPVGDALAVGQATATEDERALQGADQLRGQARLADACRAQDGEELAGAVGGGLAERLLQASQLALAPDQRRVEVSSERGCLLVERKQAVRDERLALAFQLERLGRLGLDRVADELRSLGA